MGDVVLRDVMESDIPIFFEHQRDRDAIHMAAFTSKDPDSVGWHWVTARLMMGDGREVDWTEGWAYLQTGRTNLGLAFDGRKVRRSGYTGSFLVTDFTVQGAAGSPGHRRVPDQLPCV